MTLRGLLAWNQFGRFHLASLHSAPGITLFSAVRWAQMVRLFPPWPLHKAPGGHCVSLWRVCPWSSPCCLTKLLSRYKPSLLHPHHLPCCACPKLALGNKCCVVNVLRADGKRMMSWKNWIFSWICCSRTEWVSYSFCFVFVHLQGSSASYDGGFCFDVCMFHIAGFSDGETQRGAVYLQ